jgi:rhodanese-related sulfurtransferase
MGKMREITFDELSVMPKDSYVLIDIRDEGIASYGMIPGAVNIPVDVLEDDHDQRIAEIPKGMKLIFYCQIGRRSRELGGLVCIEGCEAFSLQDGYIEANIFNSMENVDLGAVIGYKKDGVRHSFLEEY